MGKSWADVQRLLKRGLAGLLFILLLLGGSAAVFSLLAAGISQLSNSYREPQPVVAVTTAKQTTNPNDGQQNQAQTPSVQYPNVSNGSTQYLQGQDSVDNVTPNAASASSGQDASNDAFTHMHSPIGDAMDNGGVYLGQQIGRTFGSLLKGALQTLFLEQNDAATTGAGNNG